MKSDDPPLNDPDHNAEDAGRSTTSTRREVHRQNLYMHWALQRWTRAQHDAAAQCHRSHQRLFQSLRRPAS